MVKDKIYIIFLINNLEFVLDLKLIFEKLILNL